jgi:1,5-anhydro-D-fructose reductase (1,5-anhydro-D-mannitol-forming)
LKNTKDRIKLGIVGLGAMGLEMLSVATNHPNFNLICCADINEQVINKASKEFPSIHFTTSTADVLDSLEIEAVYIATPPIFHADYAIRAMNQGKAVFCEKPLSISLADGKEMLKISEKTGVATALNFALSDRHATLELERAIKNDEVGDIRGVEVRLLFPRWVRDFQVGATWLEGREQGGFIREVFSHFAYLTDRLLGPITTEFTQLHFPPENPEKSETFAFGLFKAGDVPVTLIGHSGLAVPELYEWFIYGTKRSYCLRNWGDLFIFEGNDWQSVALSGDRGSEFTRLSAFSRKIKGGREDNLSDFSAGFRVQQIVESFGINLS